MPLPWDHPRVPDGRTIYQARDDQDRGNDRFVRLLYLCLVLFVCLLCGLAIRLPWSW